MTAPVRTLAAAAGLAALVAAGCQQRMADQPSPRPYEINTVFAHGQSARPLERGVVHRNQRTEGDPLVTWLTPEGRRGRSDVKWSGDASNDPNTIVPPLGAPDKVENFVAELPFEMTETDLKRGQKLYNAACALCHGAAGYGNGKIFERGYLRPPSYHTDPTGQQMDWSTMRGDGTPAYSGLPAGYSRGFQKWHKIPLKEVPIGYIYQVITWGFNGMPSHETQLPDPADRWRVAAYVRTLQISQGVPEAELTPEGRQQLAGAGGKK
jgi:cytochrome c553